jgi:4-carboxymuconolactone decarboxylase
MNDPGDDRRSRGLAKMSEVYGWDVTDGPGDFFGLTVEHLFGEIWQRPGLSDRDRRLLVIGMLVGSGQEDVLDLQFPAALANGELDDDLLREIVIFVAHYAGWPRAARINTKAEAAISRAAKRAEASEPTP